ncbi:hypothetical protein A3H05_00450 [Candidatus Giovannonibacteria bacterium RIFCSPLOWO2_12_FULL_43_26]|nr:MAG: hypothetical protein US65_C0033G0007 [Candidatus Yanofskybacteria bacterium GW2011_GWC2_37_9]OGF92784.1 MAG: hypothetical protein A3H05_00450 [Candidatus Giovannonibacteria bacterium RIFCSPLOWO2_12_FULL_43_26]
MPSILLLDCSTDLVGVFKRQGFDVDFGSMGFSGGTRYLPSQIYEKNIIIYNPCNFLRDSTGGYIAIGKIKNNTPEYDLGHLKNHILKGATMLIFVNRVADDPNKQHEAYAWIPFMPNVPFTKDQEAIKTHFSYPEFLQPLSNTLDLDTPVMQKLVVPKEQIEFYQKVGSFVPIFLNRNDDILGLYIKIGEGRLIILPRFKSNEDIIATFLNRVMPKIYDLGIHANIIDQFASPNEKIVKEKIEKIEVVLQKATETLGNAKEDLETAKREKTNIVKSDPTAALILSYFETATQQDDVALYYLYKIIDALEKKYGGEKEAKQISGCNVEWNLIGKLANESYADIRHAPKPGEKVKEWGTTEIKSCFEAAEKIIHSYLNTLFSSSKDNNNGDDES